MIDGKILSIIYLHAGQETVWLPSTRGNRRSWQYASAVFETESSSGVNSSSDLSGSRQSKAGGEADVWARVDE